MDTLKPEVSDTFKPNGLFSMLRNNRGSINFGINRSPEGGDGGGGDGSEGGDGGSGEGEGSGSGDSGDGSSSGQGSGGGTATAWYDPLPEDLRNNPTVQKYKTNEEQVKAHLELSTLLGHEKVAIPKDEKDTVAIEQFNKAFGIPQSVEGYEMDKLENVEGFEEIDFGDDGFKEIALKRGLSNKQANGLRSDYIEMLQGIRKGNEQSYVDSINKAKGELTKEWGMAYEQNIKISQSVMNKFTNSKEEFDHINALIGADPQALKFLNTVGKQFKEGSLGDMGTPTTGFTKTPNEAKSEYEQIMQNPADVYWSGTNKEAPKVPETVRRERITHVESLMKMMDAGNS